VPRGGAPGTAGGAAPSGGATGSGGQGGGGNASGSGGAVASSGGATGMGGRAATGGTTGPGSGGAGGRAAAGGGPGSTGTAGASGGRGGGAGGSPASTTLACSAPVAPSGGLICDFSNYSAFTGRWSSSSGVTGALFAYHGGTTSTASASVDATGHDFHVIASVDVGSYAGAGIILDTCETAGANRSLGFTVSGTTSCRLELQIQTYGQKPSTESPPGGCTGTTCGVYPKASNLATTGPVSVVLSTMTNWTTPSAAQIVGVHWQLTNPAASGAACTADLHFDDVKLVP
jgi:hypothetical protein